MSIWRRGRSRSRSATGTCIFDVPKTEKGERILALGALLPRYKEWIAGLRHRSPDAWVFPQKRHSRPPMWDSGVRQALKDAARAVKPEGAAEDDPGLDFPGFGQAETPARR